MGANIIKISFIVVEYHSINDIIACVNAIIEQQNVELEYEIIVSSNSMYSLNQQEEAQKSVRVATWIFNEKNGGFAYAMNQGLKYATGDLLVIMNPDVRTKGGLTEMVSYFQSYSETVGIIAPKIINANGVIQDSLRTFITPWNFVYRHLQRLLKRKNSVEELVEPSEVDWVIGAFMMTSRTIYEKVGGLDDEYFMYCEDMDWCKRMHLQGFSVVYYPQAVIEYEGTRSARRSWKYAWIFIKSLFRYWSKF